MSLYRKYRPTQFADVYGQEQVVTTLEKAAAGDALVHAYLFAGSRGTGKTSVARILAKTVMTQGIADEKVRKLIEKGIEDGSLVDLLEIDAASNRGIDDVRDLIEKIQFSPVAAAAKVYIIDEVHMLTKEAFNALLKTLEEPPAYAYFILATTELNKIPPTIQSRCQCFPFRRIREEDIVRRLQYIVDQEHITIDRDALRMIAKASEGGMRDAISMLDQMRSVGKITADEVRARLGTTGSEQVEQMLEAVLRGDEKTIVEIVKTIEESGVPVDVFTRQILGTIREELHAAAQENRPTDAIIRMIDSLLTTIRDIRSAPVAGLVLEAALLTLARSEAGIAPTVAEKKSAEVPAPAKKEKPVEKKEEKAETKTAGIVEAVDVTVETVEEAWPSLLKDASPASVRMSLKNSRVREVNGNIVVLQFSSAFHRDRIRETEASRAVEAVLEKIFKKQIKIQCSLENAGNGDVAGSEEMVNLADAAAEIF